MYDRAGYGESDPNPNRTVENEASDIEELADQLQIGPKFYVIGVSMGSYPTWGCLRYIPNRLAKNNSTLIGMLRVTKLHIMRKYSLLCFAYRLLGVAFVVPVVNYRWPSIPPSLVRKDYRPKLIHCAVLLAKHAPSLLYWLVTRKWLPSASVAQKNPVLFFNARDLEALKTTQGFPMLTRVLKAILIIYLL